MFSGYSRGRSARSRGGRNANHNVYLLSSLAYQVYTRLDRLENKPPLTIFLLALNCAAYYVPEALGDFLPSVSEACLRPERLRRGEESLLGIFNPVRLVFSAFLHGNDYHLYHNMLSLLTNGVRLEQQHSTGRFAFMTTFLLLSSNVLYVAISHFREQLLGVPPSCAIGYSGVLFGYKIISTLDSTSGGASPDQTFLGVRIPKGLYLSWVELITIQMAYPNASFLGHLCGILSGCLYKFLFMRNNQSNGRGRGRGRGGGGGGTGISKLGRFLQKMETYFKNLFNPNNQRFYGHGRASSAPTNTSSSTSSSSSSYSSSRNRTHMQQEGNTSGYNTNPDSYTRRMRMRKFS